MLAKLLALFILVPLAEIILLVKLNQMVGFAPTIILVFATGIIGVFLARSQGLLILNQFRHSLAAGKMPGNVVIEGALLLIGAAFLLTPGLITDTLGLLLLFPPSRALFREWVKNLIGLYLRTGRLIFKFRLK